MNREAYLEAYTAPLEHGGAAAAAPEELPFLEAARYYGPQHRPFDRLTLDLLSPPEMVQALEDAGLSAQLTPAELREMMVTFNVNIDRLWEMVREKEIHIENFNKIVSEQENHIRNFRKMVDEKDTHIRNFQQMLLERDQRLEELENRQQADNLKLRRIIAGRERTIAELERQLRNLRTVFLKTSGRRWHEYRTRLRDAVRRRPRSGGGKNR